MIPDVGDSRRKKAGLGSESVVVERRTGLFGRGRTPIIKIDNAGSQFLNIAFMID
ncbi:hypothetical protein PM082_019980 [Marasmius tenuissimus]|nr:hypothetical protein PM082_019980 [Marasmius tenuissimus]